jgi:hypothetical protein
MMKELIEIGFPKNMIDMCFCFNNITSLDQAIILMTKEDGIWQHNYIRDENNLCSICGELSDHLDFIISNDNKSSLAREERESLNIRINKSSILSRQSFASKAGDDNDLLLKPYTSLELNNNECQICYLEMADNKFELACGHVFCIDCWIEYLRNKINNSEVFK